ncbi:unnamed protein product [Mucor hiemalis]
MTSILSLFYQVWACILSDNGAMNTMRINLAYTPTNSYFAGEIKSTYQQERLSRHYKIIKKLLTLAWAERNAWKDLITDKIKVSRKSSALSSSIQSSTSSTTNFSKHNNLITEEQRINVIKLYDDLNNENKWKLACSGRYVEDIMKEALEKSSKELEEYIDSFDKEELETARDYYNEASKKNFGFGGSYDQRWIQRSITDVAELFEFNDIINLADFSEGDLLHHVWLFVYNCFRSGVIEAKLGERGSVASALGRNEKRGLEAVERRERKASGAKVDTLFKAGGIHEVGCSEVGKDNVLAIDNKYLDDGIIKLPKTLRHMLKELVRVNPSKINELYTVGFLMMGLEMELVIMDISAGNTVTRISRSKRYPFPSKAFNIGKDSSSFIRGNFVGKTTYGKLDEVNWSRKRKAFV